MKQKDLFENIYVEDQTDKIYSLTQAVANIKKLEWKFNPYQKQSWGHSLHRIGPYVGRIKPAFCHFLIKYLSKKDDVILDPFCGIGTIPLEASLQGRSSYGYDLNPYGIHIAKAKKERKINIQKKIDLINNIVVDTKNISLSSIPKWVKEYYNQKTLKEILFFLDYFKKHNENFLFGCLLAISQGHRPGHLSKPCAWTLPYKPKPDDPGEYRDVQSRLINKIIRNYKDVPKNTGKIIIKKTDSRKLTNKNNSIDLVISSPPYFNTLDYIGSHRLRLAICGYFEKEKLLKLKKKTIQHKKTYLDEMETVICEIRRVLKNKGICCFVVGDHFQNNSIINTSEKLIDIFTKHKFVLIDSIEDTIPINKSVQKRTTNIKSERIIILKKNG